MGSAARRSGRHPRAAERDHGRLPPQPAVPIGAEPTACMAAALYRLNTDTDIVGIANVDTTVVIGTQSFVYVATGNDPAVYSMSKFEVPYAAVAKASFAYPHRCRRRVRRHGRSDGGHRVGRRAI